MPYATEPGVVVLVDGSAALSAAGRMEVFTPGIV
jgi:hypothetical protein